MGNYRDWHGGLCYQTIMSGLVVRWSHRSRNHDGDVSASRDGVLISCPLPLFGGHSLNELRLVIDEAESVYEILKRDLGTMRNAARDEIRERYPSARHGMQDCPCNGCANEGDKP